MLYYRFVFGTKYCIPGSADGTGFL